MCKICNYIKNENVNEKFDIVECCIDFEIVNNKHGILCNNFEKMNKNDLSNLKQKIEQKFNCNIIVENEIENFEFEYDYFIIKK